MRYQFRFELGRKVVKRADDRIEGIVIGNTAAMDDKGNLEEKLVSVKLPSGTILQISEEDLILIREDTP